MASLFFGCVVGLLQRTHTKPAQQPKNVDNSFLTERQILFMSQFKKGPARLDHLPRSPFLSPTSCSNGQNATREHRLIPGIKAPLVRRQATCYPMTYNIWRRSHQFIILNHSLSSCHFLRHRFPSYIIKLIVLSLFLGFMTG